MALIWSTSYVLWKFPESRSRHFPRTTTMAATVQIDCFHAPVVHSQPPVLNKTGHERQRRCASLHFSRVTYDLHKCDIDTDTDGQLAHVSRSVNHTHGHSHDLADSPVQSSSWNILNNTARQRNALPHLYATKTAGCTRATMTLSLRWFPFEVSASTTILLTRKAARDNSLGSVCDGDGAPSWRPTL